MKKIDSFIARILFYPIREEGRIGDVIELIYNKLHLDEYELGFEEGGYSQSLGKGNAITLNNLKYKVVGMDFQVYPSKSNEGAFAYDNGGDKKYDSSEYNLTINVYVKPI
jgi:opacity protein-like surface antigen